jgi:Sulfotransferase family
VSRNPFVFVVGCPRSGTTLLQRMLDAHPRMAVANDSHFIPRAIEDVGPRALLAPEALRDLPLTPELVAWVRGYKRFVRLHLPDDAVERAAAEPTFAAFVEALYTEFASLSGKQLGGEKTPDYVRSLPLLHTLFPWARSVHIVRDGRDVALSTLEWAREDKGPGKLSLWAEEPVAVCALWWSWQTGCGLGDAKKLPAGRTTMLRYEDLVASPEATLRPVTDFLGLPFAPEMLTFHEGKTKKNAALSAKSAWLPPTPGLRDYRTQMDARAVELFEALAGDRLKELGYELRHEVISPAIEEVAGRCRAWWDEELRRKEARLAQRLDAEARAAEEVA